MSDVVDFTVHSQARERAVSMHPALRWVVGDGQTAHRRDGEQTACGEPGPLTLATIDVPLCTSCYRRRHLRLVAPA